MNAYGRQLLTALRFLLCTTVVLGLVYPALVFGLGQLIAPAQANGSLVGAAGKATGSALLAQPVAGEEFFYPRPSAVQWDPAGSSPSNLGPNQPALVESIETNRAEVAAREKVAPDVVPIDAVTASGSGLDPEISLANARMQLPRVAAASGLGEATVNELISDNTNNVVLGFLGQSSVNTTTLNAALMQAKAKP